LKRETRDLLFFFSRPSTVVVLITLCVQVFFPGDLSRFGNALFSQWDHLSWTHWLGNILPLYFLTFFQENRIGKSRTWIFIIFCLTACRLSFELPWAPRLNELTHVVGLSGLVCGFCGYWFFNPVNRLACTIARTLTLLLIGLSIQADVYTRWGHMAGWISGVCFFSVQLAANRLKKSQ
jgi:membrane associated rhomboid family serine protease